MTEREVKQSPPSLPIYFLYSHNTGGDIRALAQAALAKDSSVPRKFFGPEFVLVDKIFKYPFFIICFHFGF